MSNNIVEFTRAEVERWYGIFYAWTRGLVSAQDQSVRHIYASLATDFRVVLPSGVTMDRDAYWERLTGLYATRKGNPPSEITNLTLHQVSEDHVLAVFDLLKAGVPGKKVDTALLRRDEDAPCGMSWVHVHESDHSTGAT